MAVPPMMARHGMRRGFALNQLVLRDDRRRGAPLVRAVSVHSPSRQASAQLVQGRLVTPATCPVQQPPGVTIQGLPTPELAPFLLEVLPPLLQLQDSRFPRGLRRLIMLSGPRPDPVAHGLGGAPEEQREAVHGE